MRALALGAILAGLLVSSPPSGPQTATPEEEVMWRKLDLAHDALDAVALDDFEALAAYADDLLELARAGEWLESDSPGYRTESEQFRGAARALGAAARERDSKAAALAYLDLTMRCLRCHRALGTVPPR